MKFHEINLMTEEGKLLVMAIGSLTASPTIHINGKEMDGRKMTPDEVIDELEQVARKAFTEKPS